MRQLCFKRYRFPPKIIAHAIWLYARFTLSFKYIEEMLAERGLDVSDETVRRWFLTFGSIIAANLRRTRPDLPPEMVPGSNGEFGGWRLTLSERM